MEELTEKNFYQTSDLSLAGAISLHYPLEAVDREDPRRVSFVFKREEGLDELIEKFWRGELKGDLKAYFYQLKTLKSRIYEKR